MYLPSEYHKKQFHHLKTPCALPIHLAQISSKQQSFYCPCNFACSRMSSNWNCPVSSEQLIQLNSLHLRFSCLFMPLYFTSFFLNTMLMYECTTIYLSTCLVKNILVALGLMIMNAAVIKSYIDFFFFLVNTSFHINWVNTQVHKCCFLW